MFINLIEIKYDIEKHVKKYLIASIKNNSYNYTTFGKEVENLIVDSLDAFFTIRYDINKEQCKRAKDKNEFPDYLLLEKHAIEFKSAINSQEPENDLGTINSWPEKLQAFCGNSIYFLFVKYAIEKDSVLIMDIYFDYFYKFIGKSKLNTLKYREKDGNLRPKPWRDFTQGKSEWNSIEEFNKAFISTKSVRAKRLVEKHFEDMSPAAQSSFIDEYILKRKK